MNINQTHNFSCKRNQCRLWRISVVHSFFVLLKNFHNSPNGKWLKILSFVGGLLVKKFSLTSLCDFYRTLKTEFSIEYFCSFVSCCDNIYWQTFRCKIRERGNPETLFKLKILANSLLVIVIVIDSWRFFWFPTKHTLLTFLWVGKKFLRSLRK